MSTYKKYVLIFLYFTYILIRKTIDIFYHLSYNTTVKKWKGWKRYEILQNDNCINALSNINVDNGHAGAGKY